MSRRKSKATSIILDRLEKLQDARIRLLQQEQGHFIIPSGRTHDEMVRKRQASVEFHRERLEKEVDSFTDPDAPAFMTARLPD